MGKRSVFFLQIMLFALMASGEINSFDDLIDVTIQACLEPERLLAPGYTNDLVNYRNTCTNEQWRCAADLSLAIALMHRLDADESCIGDAVCLHAHQSLVSNIVNSTELDQTSWIRYAAAVEYITGLNYEGKEADGFEISTNMLARLSENPANMGTTNYWAAMARLHRCPDLALDTALRLNAALGLAEQNRWSEIGVYTNSLPPYAVEIFLEDAL